MVENYVESFLDSKKNTLENKNLEIFRHHIVENVSMNIYKSIKILNSKNKENLIAKFNIKVDDKLMH